LHPPWCRCRLQMPILGSNGAFTRTIANPQQMLFPR
jgi:hypothetical protein